MHGISDEFVDHGTQEELLAELGLDANGIAKKVANLNEFASQSFAS
jgi:deoxyxylulose-5-phosphate synthase